MQKRTMAGLIPIVLAAACSSGERPRDDDPRLCIASTEARVEPESRLFPRSAFRDALGCTTCTILNVSELRLPRTGVLAASAKYVAPGGDLAVATLTADHKLASEAKLFEAERLAGRIEPALAAWLKRATSGETAWVWIQAATPNGEVIAREKVLADPHPRAVESGKDDEPNKTLLRQWLSTSYPAAEYADASGPIIRARLAASAIAALGSMAAVSQIGLDGGVGRPSAAPWSAFSQWGETVRLRGACQVSTGVGSRICVKEPSRPDDMSMLEVAQIAAPASTTTNSHARMVAGIIRNTLHAQSVAPAAAVYLGNWVGYSGTGGIDEWCRTQATTTLNYSYSLGTTAGGLTGTDMAHDWLAKNAPYTLVVAASGEASWGADTVANRGYNGLVVGGVFDRNTAHRSDDVADTDLAWRNPSTGHGDYELPHVAAPSGGILVTGTEFTGGSSAATAMVSATSALLEQRSPGLRSWPEGKRAIIIATAHGQTDEGLITNLPAGDRRTGAGTIDPYRAAVLAGPEFQMAPGATAPFGYYYGTVFTASQPATPSGFDAGGYMLARWKTHAPRAGRLRVVLAWDSSPVCSSGICSSDVPDADFDLRLFKRTGSTSWEPTGAAECSSTTYDSTWEMCDISVAADDEFLIAVKKFSTPAGATFVGLAWTHYQLESGAACSASADCGSAACVAGRCQCRTDVDCPDRTCSPTGACVDRVTCGALGQPCCNAAVAPACNPQAQCNAGTCVSCPACQSAVSILPAKPAFPVGEPVVLRVSLPNNGDSPCLLSGQASGTLSVLSLTRDGANVPPLVPVLASFSGGYLGNQSAQLASTPAHSWLTSTWASEQGSSGPAYLAGTSPGGMASAHVVRFPIDTVGNYAAQVRYIPPRGAAPDGSLCQTASQTIAVNFTVTGG